MPSESDAEVQSRLQDSSILEPAFPNHYVRSRNDERQSRELDNRSRILNRPFLLFWQRHPRTALRRGRPLRSYICLTLSAPEPQCPPGRALRSRPDTVKAE